MKSKLKYIKMQMRIQIGLIEGTPLKGQTEQVNIFEAGAGQWK
jgi:hypothetical protein